MQNALVPFDNQNLFDDRGHLTGAGLNAMENGSLDELGSLEAAEHLSFCDACLNRYTNWLEAMPQALLSPARDIAPQVQNLLRMRSIRVFTNKYVSIAAAVILAFALWNFGAFNISTGAAQRGVDRLAEGPRFSISQSIQQFIGGIGKGIDDVLSEMQAYVQSGFAQLAEPRNGSGAETEADASSNTGSNDPGNHRQYGGVQPARGE
ncbi:MAG TPA: hypothetical protein H9706_07340 [Candidatus Gemmiger stercorigallinarum]|nr:hypothetical protein [Candidatus Gemmiger stercorigallinarum]